MRKALLCLVLVTVVGSINLAFADSIRFTNFNTVGPNNTLWVTAYTTNHSGFPSSGTVTVNLSGTFTLFDGSTNNVLSSYVIPNSTVIFSSSTTTASAVFGAGGWTINLPFNFSGQGLIEAFAINAGSSGFPTGDQQQLTLNMTSTTPGINLNWQFGSAAYTSACDFSNLNNAQVGVTGSNAGVPTAYDNQTSSTNPCKLVSGGSGGGGSGWTGSMSSTLTTKTTVTTPEPSSLALLATGLFAAGFRLRRKVLGK